MVDGCQQARYLVRTLLATEVSFPDSDPTDAFGPPRELAIRLEHVLKRGIRDALFAANDAPFMHDTYGQGWEKLPSDYEALLAVLTTFRDTGRIGDPSRLRQGEEVLDILMAAARKHAQLAREHLDPANLGSGLPSLIDMDERTLRHHHHLSYFHYLLFDCSAKALATFKEGLSTINALIEKSSRSVGRS